jgi:hypothetical protein
MNPSFRWSLASLLLVAVWAANGTFILANLIPGAAGAAEQQPHEFTLDVVWVPAVAATTVGFTGDPSSGSAAESRSGAAAPVCRAWGPFDDPDDARALARMLGVAEVDYELFEETLEGRQDHLVRVRSPGQRDAAQRLRQELLDRGFDNYLLQPGEAGYALAVGVFSSVSRAETQQRRLLDLGYDAVIEPLGQRRIRYHLLARVPVDLEMKNSHARRCGDIASTQRFL